VVKSWPVLIGAVIWAISGGFALWYSMDDYERARYFGIIAGLPISIFALLGLFGIGSIKIPSLLSTSSAYCSKCDIYYGYNTPSHCVGCGSEL
jgi:hypothetical protein